MTAIETTTIADVTLYMVDTELMTMFDPYAHKMAADLAKGWGFDGYVLAPGWEHTEDTGGATPVRLFTSDRAIAEDFLKNYVAD